MPFALSAQALWHRMVAGLFALQLAACGALSPGSPSADTPAVPAAWSDAGLTASAGSASPTPLARWWQRFDDPLLVALIDEALRANTSVRGAMAALAQSRALADVQSAALAPAVNGSASAQRSHNGDAGNSSAFRAGFDASWEPDIFGGRHAAVAAADADTRASAANLGDVQVSVAAEVAFDYLQLRGLQARLAFAHANLLSQQDTLQLTQWRQQAGLVTDLEVEQARAAAAQTAAAIPQLLVAARQAEHAIAVLTGRAPAALHARLQASAGAADAVPAAPVQPAAPPDLVLDIPADTLRQRPDVRAAEDRVSAAFARVTQADADRMPSFQLGGSLGLAALTVGGLASGSAVVGALLGSVSLPIFDGGALVARVRAQQAALDQAQSLYDAAVLTALRDVEDSLVALKNDRDRLASLRIAAEAARSAALLARQRFSSGLIDFQVVLDTQRTALLTEDSLASTEADLNADHVRLYKALGGGWETPERTAAASLPSPGSTRP